MHGKGATAPSSRVSGVYPAAIQLLSKVKSRNVPRHDMGLKDKL
jgi:hypothetical protein